MENRFRSLEEEGERLWREDLPADAGLALAQAVGALTPLQGEAVVLFEYEGMSLQEIALLTDSDVGAVKSRLHRARENLGAYVAPMSHCGKGD